MNETKLDKLLERFMFGLSGVLAGLLTVGWTLAGVPTTAFDWMNCIVAHVGFVAVLAFACFMHHWNR